MDGRITFRIKSLVARENLGISSTEKKGQREIKS